jgi:hypothetical protein
MEHQSRQKTLNHRPYIHKLGLNNQLIEENEVHFVMVIVSLELFEDFRKQLNIKLFSDDL